MINIVTVHWQTAKWIEPQLSYLARWLDEPYRLFASLNGICDRDVRDRFDLAADLEGSHAEKLNALAAIVVPQSEPDDVLVFLDGDAFPVRPIGPWIHDLLVKSPLAAVRRDENLGDLQPHPCFCVTTCGFWHDLGGDWREGGTWVNAAGAVTTDVGGTLLHQLDDGGIKWEPLLRTNTVDPDPPWFGVYEHRIYHNGAGFRERVSRVGAQAEVALRTSEALSLRGRSLEGLARLAVLKPAEVARLVSRDTSELRRAARVSRAKATRRRIERLQAREAARREVFAAEVFERLVADPTFHRYFDETEPP